MPIALLVATIGALVVTVVGWYGMVGKLPPNAFAGIRTPYTHASPERWYAVHRAGGPFLVLPGAAALAAGLALVPFALLGKLPDALVVSVLIAQAVFILAGALASWAIGTSRAKAELGG